MKRLFTLLAMAVVIISCTDDGPDDIADQITLTTNELTFTCEESSETISFTSTGTWNVNTSSSLPKWINVSPMRGVAGNGKITITVKAHTDIEKRWVQLEIQTGKAMESIKITQMPENVQDAVNLERQALIDLYKATNGDNWINKTNWCSNKHVSEWYGVVCDKKGQVKEIHLSSNNLVGSIPESIGNFAKLQQLNLSSNQLTGSIPKSIGNLSALRKLNLCINNLTGSIPESIGNMTALELLLIRFNQLTGSIPASVGNLAKLEALHLCQNQLTGEIPKSLGTLPNLTNIQLNYNQLTGEIPASLGNLTNLEWLHLNNNQLIGKIPASIGNLLNLKLKYLWLSSNQLSGKIPESMIQSSWWATGWTSVLFQYGEGFSKEGLIIPAPKFNEMCIDGQNLDYSVYAKNEYTVLYHYIEGCVIARYFTPSLVELYDDYKDKGLEVIAFSRNGTIDSHKRERETYNTKWPYIMLYNNSMSSLPLMVSPEINVVDKNGHIVFNCITDDYNDLDEFLVEKFGEPDNSELYESIDYSQNGVVTTLQTATKGNGIDLVLMGDAYSDRLIVDGTYDKAMRTAMEKFFTEEPYKSYRDHFNVYSVKAVSKNDVYDNNSETIFSGEFGEETHVGGDHQKVIKYGLKAISEERMDEAMLVVMMNSPLYAGTCYMYYPSGVGDYGRGLSISYFPVGVDDSALAQVLNHEANGHGFAKLADEYAYENMGAISSGEVTDAQAMCSYGWWKNVDFTSDITAVHWAKFIADTRYASEKLGAYEGGMTYWTGVWRPTENSIMRYNTGGFNAPSREAIYYRIHKLAYGDDWTYDYETFVEYDAINRETTTRTQSASFPMIYKPSTPPVVINKNWRNELR